MTTTWIDYDNGVAEETCARCGAVFAGGDPFGPTLCPGCEHDDDQAELEAIVWGISRPDEITAYAYGLLRAIDDTERTTDEDL